MAAPIKGRYDRSVVTVAMFGKKKKNDEESAAAESAPEIAFSPKKAKAFFDRARSVHDSESYEYAMQLWLNGLRQDPSNMDGLNGFLRSAEVYAVENPKKGVSKETKSAISAKGTLGKYINALLDFGLKRMDTNIAIKAAVAAGKLHLTEPTKMIGEHALTLAQNDPKQKKDMFVKLLDAFDDGNVYQLAAIAGEMACRLDQSDGALEVRVRNMLAAQTMSSGGYDSDEEGGFRKNIRDADKQAQLEQHDSIAKSGSVKEQVIEKTAADYESRPDDLAALNAYAKALLDRGKNADELKAMSLYGKAYKASGQFRFRQLAGEVQMRRASRMLTKLTKMIQADHSNAELKAKLEEGTEKFNKLQMTELSLQVENYPTDLPLKYRLGKLYFSTGQYNEAIEQFQLAQNEPKLKRDVLNLMGQSFIKLGGWEDAAIQTFRQALNNKMDDDSKLGMELRYALMDALTSKAEKDSDLGTAEEADKIAASIAIQQFSYRDIREKRELIKTLITSLKG
jgi:tetratricopeptide (TPR) repeat protein